jgi:hypothetical protein
VRVQDGKLAVVSYRQAGRARHALVWGAVDALPPSETVPQARFTIDWTGGWATHRDAHWWRRVGNHCSRYDGPALASLVAACTAPDGSWWALQRWQPKLPHRGYPPYRSDQDAWELDVSHWTGRLADLEVHADWAFGGQAHNLFGRLLYAGVPVHGFHTVKGTGAPRDRYGRGLYIDTFDSAYGAGWKRETSIVFRKPTGVFCYSFWPTHDVSLPGRPARPADEVPHRGSGPGRDAESRRGRPGSGRVGPERRGEGRVRTGDEGTAARTLCGRLVLPDADLIYVCGFRTYEK